MRQKYLLSLILVVLLVIVVIFIYIRAQGNNISNSTSSYNNINIAQDPNYVRLDNEMVEGFPNFPTYPGAQLERSAKMVQANANTGRGFHAYWAVDTVNGVRGVMQWYVDQLENAGWTIIEYPEDTSQGEQFMRAIKGQTFVVVVVENEGGNLVEVLVDFPLTYEE